MILLRSDQAAGLCTCRCNSKRLLAHTPNSCRRVRMQVATQTTPFRGQDLTATTKGAVDFLFKLARDFSSQACQVEATQQCALSDSTRFMSRLSSTGAISMLLAEGPPTTSPTTEARFHTNTHTHIRPLTSVFLPLFYRSHYYRHLN